MNFEIGETALYKKTYKTSQGTGYYLLSVRVEFSHPIVNMQGEQIGTAKKLVNLNKEHDDHSFDSRLMLKATDTVVLPKLNRCYYVYLTELASKLIDMSKLNLKQGSVMIWIYDNKNLTEIIWPTCEIDQLVVIGTNIRDFRTLTTNLFVCDQNSNGHGLPTAENISVTGEDACILWAIHKCNNIEVDKSRLPLTNPKLTLFRAKLHFIQIGYKQHAKLVQ